MAATHSKAIVATRDTAPVATGGQAMAATSGQVIVETCVQALATTGCQAQTMAATGDEAVLAEADRRFRAFVAKGEPLPSDLRGNILELVGRRADAVREGQRGLHGALGGCALPQTRLGPLMRRSGEARRPWRACGRGF